MRALVRSTPHEMAPASPNLAGGNSQVMVSSADMVLD